MTIPTAYPVLALNTELGEGPVWDDRLERLLLVDILGKRAHWYRTETGEHGAFGTGGVVGAVVLRQDGGLVMACHDHIVMSGPWGEEQVPLGGFSVDGEAVRFNDGKVDPGGRFVVGTMHWQEADAVGALYMVPPDRPVVTLVEAVTISNGLDWSRDGRTFYYIDTPTQCVDAFDVDPESGQVSGRRTVVKIPDGYPDGMTIDQEGCLWVAIWNGNRVDRYTPEGDRIMSVSVPGGGHVSSAAFGGPDLSTLYITTARTGLTPEELRLAPRAGDLFAFDAGVSGLPPHRFGSPPALP